MIEKCIEKVKGFREAICDMGAPTDVPILLLTAVDPSSMQKLHSLCKTADNILLKSIRAQYSVISVKDDNRFSILTIQDILKRDIDHPKSSMYYFQLKRIYQTLEKFSPEILKTFIYHDEEIPELELKIKKGIEFAFNDFIKTYGVHQICIAFSAKNGKTRTHMFDVIDKVIHENFCVINDLDGNDPYNKFVIIEKKENEENDNDAN